jgi:hypothetical protein
MNYYSKLPVNIVYAYKYMLNFNLAFQPFAVVNYMHNYRYYYKDWWAWLISYYMELLHFLYYLTGYRFKLL